MCRLGWDLLNATRGAGGGPENQRKKGPRLQGTSKAIETAQAHLETSKVQRKGNNR